MTVIWGQKGGSQVHENQDLKKGYGGLKIISRSQGQSDTERHPATGAFLFVGVGQDVKPQQPNNHVGVTPYKNVFERMVSLWQENS